MSEITSLQLIAGVAVHLTVVDHNNSDAPLSPSNLTWTSLGGFPNTLFITADATGFNFLLNSPGSGTVQAIYTNGSLRVPGPALSITVTAAVQPAYISP